MNKLMGHQLKDMAELGSVRKQKVVLLSSVIASAVLAVYGYLHFLNENYVFGILNFVCLLITIGNLIYLWASRRPIYSDVILTFVLLLQGTMMLLFGDTMENRLLWLYPILASIIFINSFTIGLILSSTFCIITGVAIYTDVITISSNMFASERFFISLLTLHAICNTSSYFYSKSINYIESLYQEGIEKLAYTDQLTGLANRWSFENWAASKLAEKRQDGTITALVFLDIDNFKHINDSFGHDMGDKVLKNFADRLKNNIRNHDRKTNKEDYSIARFAGDEFVLLLYGVKTFEDLNSILNRICHLFDNKYRGRELLNNVTISVGAALYPQDADNLPELTRCADKAMYTAKHNGKNQYQYYQNANNVNSDNDVALDLDKKVTPIKKANESHT